jgi:glycosyltransferase involved in cell wall biosynthesis
VTVDDYRKVLLVTPFFAPQSHAAMFRVHRLAKYLPRYGWKPFVVTTDRNYVHREDPDLLDDLSPAVEIHRARYVEPTLRGVRMALGGRDRRFSAGRGNAIAGADYPTRPSLLGRLYVGLLSRWIHVPDAYRAWERAAVSVASSLARKHRIPIVYTTFLPYTSCRIGAKLRNQGMRWVADFRDPGTYGSRFRSPIPRVASRQRALERMALEEADSITVLSSAYPSIFEGVHEDLDLGHNRFIPTGADDELVADVEPIELGYPYLVFSGEYLREYGAEFFEIFQRAVRSPALTGSRIRLIVIGNSAVNKPLLTPLIDRLGLDDRVDILDHISQPDLYRYICGAKAALLVPGRAEMWWNNFAKLVDYIALGVPVLAMVPDPSEARKELIAAGTGVFLDGSTDEATARLTEFLRDGCRPEVDSASQQRYLASTQVKSFSEVFDKLLDEDVRYSKDLGSKEPLPAPANRGLV